MKTHIVWSVQDGTQFRLIIPVPKNDRAVVEVCSTDRNGDPCWIPAKNAPDPERIMMEALAEWAGPDHGSWTRSSRVNLATDRVTINLEKRS